MATKKLVSVLLASALAVSAFPSAVFAANDELAGKWYEAAMTNWMDYGVISGYEDGTVKPEGKITRGELAVVLQKIMGYQTAGTNGFTDLPADLFCADAVLKAAAAGVLKGDVEGTFRPNDQVTRQEAAAMLARVMELTDTVAADAGYLDQADISDYAVSAVNAMKASGYMTGADGNFRPKDAMTRAEMATVLNNIFQGYFHEAKAYSENIVGSAVVNQADVTLKDMTISGDLIVAEGVADGDMTLDGVTVNGRLLVRGGGENSIHIKGASSVSKLMMLRQDGAVRVAVENGAKVEVVVVDDGSDEVKVEGNVGEIVIDAPNTTVTVSGTVDKVTLSDSAANVKLKTTEGATINQVVANAQGATITGDGKVSTVEANANNVAVETSGTQVNVSENVTGVTNPTKDEPKKPSGGGGGPQDAESGGITPTPTYTTVKTAEELAAALKGTLEVRLGANVNITEADISVPGKVTLNLNGYELLCANTSVGQIFVEETGDLTLKDSAGTGKIYTETIYTGADTGYSIIESAGKFTMESGYIYAVNEDAANKGQFAVTVTSNGTVTINGGKIEAGWYAVSGNGNRTDTTIIVNGGELISTADYAIYNPATNSSVTVNGGVISGYAGGISMNRGTLTVNDGIVTGKGLGSTGDWSDGTGKQGNAAINLEAKYGDVTATIYSGTFIAEGNAVLLGTKNAATMTIYGGTFSDISAAKYVAADSTIYVSKDCTVAAETTITIPASATVVVAEGVTVTVNGTIDGEGTLTVNGTITGSGTWPGKAAAPEA